MHFGQCGGDLTALLQVAPAGVHPGAEAGGRAPGALGFSLLSILTSFLVPNTQEAPETLLVSKA